MKVCFTARLHSLKHLIISKPPFIVAVSSVICFASVILCACLHINNNQIRVENFMKDWNLYLEKLESLSFYLENKILPFNSTTTSTISSNIIQEKIVNSSKVSRFVLSPSTTSPSSLSPEPIKRITVQLQMTISDPSDHLYNITSFYSYINPSIFGTSSQISHQLYLQTTLYSSWQHSKCQSSSILKINCDVSVLQACVILEGHPSLFPQSIQEPNVCDSDTNDAVKDFDYKLKIDAYHPHDKILKRCDGNIKFKHQPDPSLNVYLSMDMKMIIIKRMIKASAIMATISIAMFVLLLLRIDLTLNPANHNEQDSNRLLQEDQDL